MAVKDSSFISSVSLSELLQYLSVRDFSSGNDCNKQYVQNICLFSSETDMTGRLSVVWFVYFFQLPTRNLSELLLE